MISSRSAALPRPTAQLALSRALSSSAKGSSAAPAASAVSFPRSQKADVPPHAPTAGPLSARTNRSSAYITLFGATGFLGRYVVNALGRLGATLHIATRGDDMAWRHLKPLTDYGKLVPHYISMKDEASLYAALEQSNVVINLVGKHYDTKHFPPTKINNSIEDSNAKTAEIIARVSRRAGIHHLVHVSSLRARPNANSRFGKAKFAGEEAVLREFPGACIVRPGTMYGEEDRFLNWYASYATGASHSIPLFDGGKGIVRPVFVGDVAQAVAALAAGPGASDAVDEIFELPGPEAFTHKQIAEYVYHQIQAPARAIDVPSSIGSVLAKFGDFMPNPSLTPDLLQVFRDDEVVSTKRASSTEKGKEYTVRGWECLHGLVPQKFEAKAFNYLHRYRKGGHFRELRLSQEEERERVRRLHQHKAPEAS